MQDAVIIGRKGEMETLERLYQSRKSEFAIVYGRRRVGKTFLIHRFFGERFTFRVTALAKGGFQKQINNFYGALYAQGLPTTDTEPSDWFAAFRSLMTLAEADPRPRKVIFLDELPWFDTRGSDFLSALEHFWNSWASYRSDVLLVCCGSAAAWMMNKLINDRGGLHNRVTERILLQPFTLSETEAFLRSKGAVYDRYQLIELYMAMGGIPFYLDNIIVNKSVPQNIDRMFFSPGGLLISEYHNLFRSLFKRYERHVSIVEALAQKSKGMTRSELLEQAGLTGGGSMTNVLDELEHSGFIRKYAPFGKIRRDHLYQLTDPFILFYHAFVKDTKAGGEGAWTSQAESPKWRAWSGYAFESVCMYHINALKKHLGIAGVYTEISGWRSAKSEGGAQIDLLIDRNDRVIHICEIKFSIDKYTLSKSDAESIARKLSVFREETGTTKTLFMTLITTFGLKPNEHSMRWVQCDLDMNALFE